MKDLDPNSSVISIRLDPRVVPRRVYGEKVALSLRLGCSAVQGYHIFVTPPSPCTALHCIYQSFSFLPLRHRQASQVSPL